MRVETVRLALKGPTGIYILLVDFRKPYTNALMTIFLVSSRLWSVDVKGWLV